MAKRRSADLIMSRGLPGIAIALLVRSRMLFHD